MSDNCGITINIEEIRDVMCRLYSKGHSVGFDGLGGCWIEDSAGMLEIDFGSLDDIYRWTLEQQAALDELETEQSVINDKINHDSASVDIMKQRF